MVRNATTSFRDRVSKELQSLCENNLMTGPVKELTWEFIRRLSMTVPMLIPAMILIPMALEGLFRIVGLQIGVGDIPPLSWHCVYLVLGFMLLAVPLIEAYKGVHQRLYALPISNKVIASWMMISAVVTVVCQEVLVHWLYGFTLSEVSYVAVFGKYQSVLSTCQPIFATAVCIMMAMFWNMKFFRFRKLLVCVFVWILYISWIFSRYFPHGFHFPNRLSREPEAWMTLSVTDCVICLSIIAASWVVTYRGIVRDRCGDNVGHSFLIRAEAFTARLLAIVFPDGSRTHNSPEAAVAWHEWRSRGRDAAVAGVIGLGLLLSMIVFMGGSSRGRNPVVGVMLLLLVPGILGMLVGSVLGVLAPPASRERMTNFLATTPVSDARLARGLLRNAFRTTLIAWVLVLIPGILALVASLLYKGTAAFLVSVERLNHDPDFRLGAMTIPCVLAVSFLLAWTLTGTLAVLHWTGSRYLGLVILVAGIADFIMLFVLRFTMSEETHAIVKEATFGIVSGFIVIGSALGFGAALKRKLIEPGSAAMLLSFWVLEAVLCWLHVPAPAMHRLFLGGILILSVSPVALAPLALSRNRHAA
jgi:hypothetical protein